MQNYKSTKLACYISYIVQAITINLAPLFYVIFNRNFGVSVAELGFITFFNFIIQLAMDLISIKIISALGHKKSAVLANFSAALGVCLLGILPQIMNTFLGILTATLFFGIGAGIIEVGVNPIISALPNDNNSKAISLLHSFYSWGQTGVILVSTLSLFIIGEDLWFLLPLIWSLIPLANAFIFAKSNLPDIEYDERKMSIKSMLSNKMFLIFVLIMICSGSTEIVISQWASYFAERGLGVSKVAGDLLGPCIFALMMGIGRTLYGLFGEKISISRVLCICSFLCVLSYVGISLIKSPVLVMLCFALVGLGVSLAWPGTLAASAEHLAGAGTAMYAFLALSGDIGCSVGPWLVGIVNDITATNEHLQFLSFLGFNSEQTALRSSVLAATVFPVIMLIATAVLLRKSHKKK